MRAFRNRLLRRSSKKAVLVAVFGLIVIGLIGGGAYATLGGNILQSSSGSVDLQKGLIGWWKLDGGAVDATPNTNNGTISGALAISDRKAKLGGAMAFDGIDDVITVPNSSSVQVTGSQTISMWLKPADFNLRRNPIAKAFGGEGTITQETSGSLTYYYGTGGGNTSPYQGIGSGYALPLNAWTHVIIVRDLTSMQLTWYVNGQQTQQGAASYAAATASSAPLFIGDGYVDSYSGSIDDVRLYNRALSAAETKALYESYDSQIYAGSGQRGLVGWWKMDGNAKDATPNANNGAVNGPVLTTDRKGRANSAYSFAGSGTNNLNLGNSTAFNSPEVTMSAWIYPTALNTQNTIMGKEFQYKFRITSNGGIGILASGNGTSWSLNSVVAIGAITANNWYHVVFTISSSGNVARVYINGNSVGTSTLGTTITTYNSNPMYVGSYNSSGSEPFTGKVDDARFYNRVLAAAEIKQQYESYDSQLNLNSSPTNTVSGGNINQGLVGYWPFSGNAKDATPQSGNGTLVNTPVLAADRFNRSNSAYSFTAASLQEITVPDSAALSPTAAVTLSLWFKGTVQNTSYGNNSVAGIVNKDVGGATAQNPPYGFQVSNGKLTFVVNNSSNVQAGVNAGGLIDNTWYHGVGTFDGTNLRIYLNGSLVQSSTQTNLDDTTGLLRIGSQKNGFGRYFNGTIDEVRVYNRALNLSEVQALYASQN